MAPWECWYGTSPADTYAPSYAASATIEAGAVAGITKTRNRAKYSNLDPSHYFQPVAVETSGALGPDTFPLLKELGHKICSDRIDQVIPLLDPTFRGSHTEGKQCQCNRSTGQYLQHRGLFQLYYLNGWTYLFIYIYLFIISNNLI